MSKLLNGDGSYSCFECGTPSMAPYGKCPQCELVKIQRDSATAAQERFKLEMAQRESHFREANAEPYDETFEKFKRYMRNKYFSDDDFPDTPEGQAALEKYRPVRDAIIAERRAQGLIPPEEDQSSFLRQSGVAIGGLLAFAATLVIFVGGFQLLLWLLK